MWLIFTFAFGACIGSFLNVVVYRLPRGQNISWPPSHCPKCGRGIHWYDNIPILSWVALRGRCRFCRTSISPQYILVEATTGLMLAGLYLCYFVLRLRRGDTTAQDLDLLYAWPMFTAHAALLCGLLACALVDLKFYMVPLSVMWVVALFGAAAVAVRPHPFLPSTAAVPAAMSAAAGLGLVVSLLAQHWGFLTPSFVDANATDPAEAVQGKPHRQPSSRAQAEKNLRDRQAKSGKRNRGSIGATAADGLNPRLEILREVLFLMPAIVLAIAAWAILNYVPAAGQWWSCWFDVAHHPTMAPRMMGLGGALLGFLIGGAWVWTTRILGTLIAGREAMGLGDVHILAGVGAVTGWVVPSLAFFVAPLSGLLLVLYLFFSRRQRELPYGPWLAVGTVVVMICYDFIVDYIGPGLQTLAQVVAGT